MLKMQPIFQKTHDKIRFSLFPECPLLKGGGFNFFGVKQAYVQNQPSLLPNNLYEDRQIIYSL
jgi:hypothetical protein